MKLLNPETGEIWDSETGEITKPETRMQKYERVNASLEPEYNPAEGQSFYDNFMAGAGKSVVDTGRGISQLLGNEVNVEESRKLDAPLMDTGAGMLGNVAGSMAQMTVPGMALKGAGMVPGLSSLGLAGNAMLNPQTAKLAAGLGAGYGAIQPATSATDRAYNTGLGGVGGAVGQTIGQFVNKGIGTTSKYMRTVADKFRKLGGVVPPGQATGSVPLKITEASFQSNPMTAGRYAAMQERNQSVLNRVVLNAVGESGDEITEESMLNAATNIGNRIKSSIKDMDIKVGDEMLDKLSDIELKYIKRPTIRGNDAYRNARDYLLDMIGTGKMDGKAYAVARSELGKMSHKAWNSVDNANPTLGEALDEMIDALDDHVARQIPADKVKLFKDARRQWANFKALEASQNGVDVSGPKLANYLKKKQKAAFRRGKGSSDQATQDMYDAANFADKYRRIVGTSGTAERSSLPMMTGQAGLGGGLGYLMSGDPMTALALAAASPSAMKLAQLGLTNRPVSALLSSGGITGMGVNPAIGQLLQSGGAYAGAPIGLLGNK